MNSHVKIVRKSALNAALIFAAGLLVSTEQSYAQANQEAAAAGSSACVGDNGGITLSPGFCATVFADKLGHARHMAVAPNGVVYVNTWSGRYYHDDTPPPGGFLIALQDTKGARGADKIVRFGPTRAEGNKGEPASLSTGVIFTPKPTIALCATRCRQTELRQPCHQRLSSRDCR